MGSLMLRLSSHSQHDTSNRRGAIIVLAAVCMIMIFAFCAFTVDVGYMTNVKAELQLTADAAAMGSVSEIPNGEAEVKKVARQLAELNPAAGKKVTLNNEHIELGKYDLASKSFVVNPAEANAVRITARAVDQPTFIAGVIGHKKFTSQAKAVAMLAPRDIVFVVDLSGSMNDDTEPCWASSTIDSTFKSQGFPSAGADLMKDLFTDFGYGSYPGSTQYIGSPVGITANNYAYAELTKDNGPLTGSSINSLYRIANNDSEATRKTKAYRWIIDKQIAVQMPKAKPAPNSQSNYSYWEKYLDYIIESRSVGSNPPSPPSSGGGGGSGGSGGGGGGTTPTPPKPPSGMYLPNDLPENPFRLTLDSPRSGSRIAAPAFLTSSSSTATMLLSTPSQSSSPGLPRNGSTLKVTVPPSQDGERITGFNNPNKSIYPSAGNANGWRNKIGYITYVQYMMDWGRDRSPTYANGTNANLSLPDKTPLSVHSPDCPYHKEATPAGNFDFPPREQPMHAVRRSLIAALDVVDDMNKSITPGFGDRIAIITFDAKDAYHEPEILVPLTSDYRAAMVKCTTLQATSDVGNSTATEIGMSMARELLKDTTDGGQGRKFADKVMVLLTDGVPNVWETPASEVETFISENPSDEYYDSDYIWYNSAIMQAAKFQQKKGSLYPVGMGMGADYTFMDKLSRTAATDDSGKGPRGSGNPKVYEQTLTDIFKDIIKYPGSRLVE